AGPRAVGGEVPGGDAVVEGLVEEAADLVDGLRGGEGGEDLDAAVEVAVHEVGRTDPRLGLAAVLEPEDPAVLEEPAEDGPHRDRLRQPGHAGPQRADAPGEQLDADAGPGGAVEGVDDGL